MNRLIVLGLAATFGAGNLALRAMQGNPPVELQPASPGVTQTGNLNISGTATVGILKSQNTVFGQATSPTGISYGGFFTAASNQARGFYGFASSPTGLTYGGFFQNASSQGRAVYGLATGTTADNYGGYFQAAGTSARGVLGIATATSGITYGVYGRAMSTNGYGIYGLASANTGGNAGGFFQSNSEEGNGVVGIATSTIGSTSGVYGQSASVEGYGVYGKATNPGGYGVFSDGRMHSTGVISGNGSGLTSVNAALLGGLSSSAFLQAIPNPLTLSGTSSSHIVSGQNSSTVSGASGVYGLASGASGQIYGVQGTSGSTNGFGVFGAAPATSGPNFGGRFESASSSGTGVFGEAKAAAGTNYGVYGKAVSPNGFGVFSEGNMQVTGAIMGNRAVLTGLSSSSVLYAENTSIDWYTSAIKGVSSGATGEKYGIYGQALNSLGTGVYGEGGGAGVQGKSATSFGVYGTGYYGVRGQGTFTGISGQSSGTEGTGVEGDSGGSGLSYGGKFSASSSFTDSAGVFAEATATTGTTYGVWGQSASTTGFGVIGIAPASTGTTYGVYGRTTSTVGWSVYAQGQLGASGTKSFRIDHPFDPENKYLLHYSTESPMPQNFYVGNVTTDAKGYAWVELPDYFAEINANFKYQLTVVRDDESPNFVQAQIGKKIKGNRFLIMSSAPNTEVSWRVDADRNDLYVRNRPPKDVVAKEGREKGTYQHPEFYDLGPERGMNYDASRDKHKAKSPPDAPTKSRSK